MKPALKKQPLISAIIPVAGFPNGVRQINQWLSDPSLKYFEIIFVIDTNSKKTEGELEEIAHKLRNITDVKILKSTSRNPGGTRNLGLKSAKGQWISFWDCDDVPNPSKFLEMAFEASRGSADVAIGAFSVKSESTSKKFPIIQTSKQNVFEAVALNPGLWRFMFKTELANKYRFIEIRMAEDQIYLLELLPESNEIIVCDEEVYEYWLYPNGQLTKNKSALRDLSQAFSYVVKLFQRKKTNQLIIVLTRLFITSLKSGEKGTIKQVTLEFSGILLRNMQFLPVVVRTIKLVWKAR